MRNNSVFKSLIWVLAWGLVFYLFFSIRPYNSPDNAALDYGKFLDQVEAGNISSIYIEGSGETRRANGAFYKPIGIFTNFSTVIPGDGISFVTEKLREKDTDTKKVEIVLGNSSSPWSGLLYTWGPILLMVGFWIFFMRQMQAGGNKALSFGKSKAKLVSSSKKVTFKDVAGVEEAKAELQETVDFLKKPAKFQKLGGRLPKGVLLMGPPGTGKTLLARAVAGEANVPFFSISGSDFVEMFVGVGASRVRDLFTQGKKNAPCIIFIDEIDAVGRHRGTGIGGGHDEREQTLNQLLVEMDGFESNEGTIIIAASNRPDVLDPALLRPGRFDRNVVVDMPDIKGREEILKIHTRKVPLDGDVDLAVIARGTPGFSGADLAEIVNEAAINAAGKNKEAVSQSDFEFGKDKRMMGSERRTLVISETEKRTTAVHEAGHAILTLVMPHADPLHKVTIIPRGRALGLTSQLPLEDRHNYTKDYLESQLVILMGGRCAEEVLLRGQKTTGAKNDIETATEIAKQMVEEWGMSDLGPQSFAIKEGGIFLGKRMAERTQDFSEETRQKIDGAIMGFINRAYEQALRIIKLKEKVVEKIANELIISETLTGEQIKKLVFPE